MKKRMIAVVLCLGLLLSLAGCGMIGTPAGNTAEENVAAPVDAADKAQATLDQLAQAIADNNYHNQIFALLFDNLFSTDAEIDPVMYKAAADMLVGWDYVAENQDLEMQYISLIDIAFQKCYELYPFADDAERDAYASEFFGTLLQRGYELTDEDVYIGVKSKLPGVDHTMYIFNSNDLWEQIEPLIAAGTEAVAQIPTAGPANPASDFDYIIQGTDTAMPNVSIRNYIGQSDTVVIPTEIEGIPVETIGPTAFSPAEGVTLIKSVYIPEGVRNLNGGCFEGQSLLTEVYIPATAYTIWDNAFKDCTSLTDITIRSDHGDAVGSYIFDGCTALESVYFNCNFQRMHFELFRNSSIKRVRFGENVSAIDNKTFHLTDTLEAVEVDEDNQYFCSVDGVLYSKDMTTLYVYPPMKTDTAFTVPEGVVYVSDYAFQYNDFIQSLTFADTVETIGVNVAYDAASLREVYLPRSITKIGSLCFAGCKDLTAYVKDGSVGYDYVEHFHSQANAAITNTDIELALY